MYDPLYQTAVRLNVPLAVHGGSSAGLGLDLYDSFVKILVMEHAVAQQIHFTSYLLDGAPVRFPTLKMAFLEAGVGWVPYLMERLDEKYEKLPHQAPLLTMNRATTSGTVRFIFPASSKKRSCRTWSGSVWKKRSCIHRTIRTSGRHWKSSWRTFPRFRAQRRSFGRG